MKDLDVKIFDNQLDFEEKIAKRYNELIKEVKDELKDIGIVGLSEDAMFSALEKGQFGGEKFAKLRDEIEMIKEHVDAERLALALKNENLSETAKITYEYERQDRLLKNSLELQKAIKEGRYLTNANGGIDFLDENGNILKALERDQEKEFLEQAKKIQTIADEELKIFAEKNEKISEIEMSFQKERQKLNEGYFEKDKELRLRQNAMSEEFYRQELERMGALNGMVREVASGGVDNATPLSMGEKSESHKVFRAEET